ncbi:hypothetical protein [Paenibacillus donghaensis]|uniref:Uncharacterized protein n=1 Tax=Paenibacillus donghaensis TaxID=414771 RepID=A0A2Z2KT41_9BACL|nr:hypothetical protein [Paenibacillus donghaensis]ASA24892.1 hypothetical protein B9T62_31540 [Paenibacillus donghaensis]
MLFHPGDGNGEGGEMGLCFPGLFPPPSLGTPILDKIQERLETSGLTDIQLSILKETTWIPTPEDVIALVFKLKHQSISVSETTFFIGAIK